MYIYIYIYIYIYYTSYTHVITTQIDTVRYRDM